MSKKDPDNRTGLNPRRSDDKLSMTSRVLLWMTGGVPKPAAPVDTLSNTSRRMLRLPPAESDE